MLDPSHSVEEQRFLVLGMSTDQLLLVVAYAERRQRTRIISARKATRRERHDYEKARSKSKLGPDRDTLLPEYDFSKAARGVTAARYAEGTNVVVLDPELRELFPTSDAVNDALRELAAIARRATASKRKKRSA
jgi:hypothetical protein